MLRRIFGSKRKEVREEWRQFQKRSFIIFTSTKYYNYQKEGDETDGACSTLGEIKNI
jgi:hypothetical protein